MNKPDPSRFPGAVVILCICAALLPGCRPADYRRDADRAATSIIRKTQYEALGRKEEFTIERPVETLRRKLLTSQNLPYAGRASLGTDKLRQISHWPEKNYPPRAKADGLTPLPEQGESTLCLALIDALQVAAANSRDYQTRKEDVYRAALDMDLESDEFRNTFTGVWDSLHTRNLAEDATVRGWENSAEGGWSLKLKTGATVTANLALDLVKLLTLDRPSSFGILADATITIPLLRDAGWHIVTEPLTQAERDVIYALHTLERFKRTLAVQVASEYLTVLRQLDEVKNQKDNYRRLIGSARRASRLAEAGRLPAIQVDQARQDELRARDRWIGAQQSYAQRLDRFKITLGLPTDAEIELDPSELQRLAEAAKRAIPAASTTLPGTSPSATGADAPIHLNPPDRETGGPMEMAPSEAIAVALRRRVDLRTSLGRVYDAQRRVVVAANALQTGLTLKTTARAGERRGLGDASKPSAHLRPENGLYTFGLNLDLPIERTAERNAYRDSYIALERAARDVQELEDQIKLDIRNALRNLLEARESYKIQAQSVVVAERRVASTELFLEAGRAQIRDVLESQEALVSAQNELTAALVNYRVAELELQRDMGALEIDERGLWNEYQPGKAERN